MNPVYHVLYYKYKHTYSPPSSLCSFLLSAQALYSFLSLLFPLPDLRDLTPEGLNLLGRLLFGSTFGPSEAPVSFFLP